jgi:seryl-tRNA synthetase
MSDKKTRTVSLDPENDEWLSEKDNASATVNDLVTQLREGGDKATAVLDLQIQQKRREITEAENRVERLNASLDELLTLRETMDEQEVARLNDAREALSDTELSATNPAVKNWASKLGLKPVELIEQLQ